MPGALPYIIEAVLGKLDRKTMVGRFVKTGNKPLDQLFGKKLKAAGLLYFFEVYLHNSWKNA